MSTLRHTRYQAAVLDHQALLLVQCAFRNGPIVWILPGGGREEGEGEEDCVVREVREETGLDVRVERLLFDRPAEPPDGPYIRWRTYLCSVVSGSATAGGGEGPNAELIAVAWLPIRDERDWPADIRSDVLLYPQLQDLRAILLDAGDTESMTHERSTIGLQRGTVRLVPADPSWPDDFRFEVARLQLQIEEAGLPSLMFEHIGSTAVPGLAAKPIIDLLAGYDTGITPERYFAVLQRAGYEHRGPQGVANRELFVLGPERRRTHHLNLVAIGGAFWRDHLAFRDRLREEPDVRAAYAALKQRLAASHSADRSAYTAGKAGFVEQITQGQRPSPAT